MFCFCSVFEQVHYKYFTATRPVRQLQLRNLNRRIVSWSLLKHLFILREEARPEAADLTLKTAELHKDCH